MTVLRVPAASAEAPEVTRQLAPTGRLRAAINTGNSVLAGRDAAGELVGISVDLAREIARRLALPLDLVPFDAAGKVTASAGADTWDVAFLAIDPDRAREIAFSPPYVVIEGSYLVPAASPFRAVGDLDRDGVRIAVGRGSAYDMFLARSLSRATRVPAETSQGAIDLFVAQRLDAAAGVRQPLMAYARAHPDTRVIPGRFTAIEQAVGVPQGRPEAAAHLREIVEELKAAGFVAAALARHGQTDADVAPPASR